MLRSIVITFFLAFPVLLPIALADDFSSSNFVSRDPVIDDFGGFSSGSSFQQFDAGAQAAIGESVSTNFILRSGFLYFSDYTVRSQNWRWYTDETSVTPTTALSAENVAPSAVENLDTLKLRWTFKEFAGIASSGVKFKLQFDTSSAFSSPSDVVASASCTGASLWCYAEGAGDDNGLIDANVLSDSDSCSGGSGAGCGTHNESGTNPSTYVHRFNAAAEFEFTIKPSGPEQDTVYYFRAVPITGGVAVEPSSGKTFPSLTVEGAKLTFTVEGIASGTATEGVTTDVTTSSVSIPFGSLAFGSGTEAAQKLIVTTNAQDGYTIYLRGGPLLNLHAQEIEPVSGTNASPVAWSVPGGQTGAFGYHSGDALLGTGTATRFSADDTYAELEDAAREIVFNDASVDNEETDIVYKVEVQSLQASGTYTTELMYIIVPIF